MPCPRNDATMTDLHHRRSTRLGGYDYSTEGAYFVTITTYRRTFLFGEILEGLPSLNQYGRYVQECWQEMPVHSADVQCDAFIVMPNHIHGIVIFSGVGTGKVRARHALPLQRDFGRPPANSLHSVVGSFKSAAARRINILRGTPAAPVWQRNYYERVIRNEGELYAFREYIKANPTNWQSDEEFVL